MSTSKEQPIWWEMAQFSPLFQPPRTTTLSFYTNFDKLIWNLEFCPPNEAVTENRVNVDLAMVTRDFKQSSAQLQIYIVHLLLYHAHISVCVDKPICKPHIRKLNIRPSAKKGNNDGVQVTLPCERYSKQSMRDYLIFNSICTQ